MAGRDTYKEVKVMEFPGMVARVYRPDLTEEERARRMKQIHDAAAKLLESDWRKKDPAHGCPRG